MSGIIAKQQTHFHNTTCPYCGVGCGVTAEVLNDQVIGVKGREDHPANYGRLCVKGSALHETLSMNNRLLRPEINGETCSWDTALDFIANKWKTIISQHGPDSVAFYLSGQLLTEDYYVANKLLKGFIGTANVDTNSRLCMSSAVVAHKRAFGGDAVPACYEDLELTDAIFAVGSNTAYAHPIVFQRIAKAKKERDLTFVVIDPRRTATCELADLHVALRPGSDAFFFNGLLAYLAQNQLIDHDYVQSYCDGFEQALQIAIKQTPNIEVVANICDVDASVIKKAYEIFAQNPKVVTLFSQGINQSTSGVDKGNSIINCHLATGKIGKVGSAPFSITGQPNAMGGREVGGLANQFAAHMGFSDDAIERVKNFWSAPNVATKEGLKAVDMFQAVKDGKIKSIWIMATNPVVSMPEADLVKQALEKCELVIVSDCMADTDTIKTANVKLPATSWSEKHGTVTNSERCISLQKGVVSPPGEARNDWQILCEFAKRLGYEEAFDYDHPAQIFREHAALSGLDNHKTRAFDISGLTNIQTEQYEDFTPQYWPINTHTPNGSKRLFTDGYFFTKNGRAKLIPIEARFPQKAPSKGEFTLNTGRIRDQWHTMTRTGKAPRLHNHTTEPFVQIHPEDAENLGIIEQSLVKITNPDNRYASAPFIGRANLSKGQRNKELFIPMHWNQVYASNSRADALVNAFVDPISGQPEFKQTPVTLCSYKNTFESVLISETEVVPDCEYWVKSTVDQGYSYQLADTNNYEWETWLDSAFPSIIDWVFLRENSVVTRALGFKNNRLCVAFFSAKNQGLLPDTAWLTENLGQSYEGADRFKVLAGQPSEAVADVGKIICSCFQIGENPIIEAISQGVGSVEQLGNALKCGTNCGSCIPELSALVTEHK